MEAVELLIRNHLVNMQQYDLHLAQVWKEFTCKDKRTQGSMFALKCFPSYVVFSVLPVNGEWLKLHGCGIRYAIGKNPAGG